jgi:hypothetical protein
MRQAHPASREGRSFLPKSGARAGGPRQGRPPHASWKAPSGDWSTPEKESELEHSGSGVRHSERSEHGGKLAIACRKPKFRLETDLILTASTRLQLEESLAKLRHHKTIYDEWNFASIDPLGSGTLLNFYGPPGTGKTMAGEAFAGTLGLPFMHVGIAELESKFMGETAKNIQRAFEEAAKAGAVILFDEADTLLGRRLSSVTQGIDHEVNSMRSTLLIELERFAGIAIFATNFARNYDEAFRSRITHHVRFDLPDRDARARLWDRMLLPTIPVEGERSDILEACVDLSDGFSGRDVRTCMRIALPKPLMNVEHSRGVARLAKAHLVEAIAQVRRAHAEVGGGAMPAGQADVAVARSLLGLPEPHAGQ